LSALPEFAAEPAQARAHQHDAPAAPSPCATSGDHVKPRVVIVDEHQLLSDGVRQALEQNGVDVLGVATSASGAVDAVALGLADAVIFCMRTQSGVDRLLATVAPAPSRPLRAPVSVFAPGLTSRERQVLRLLIEGASNKDVARRLAIRSNTVRTHVQNLLTKLRVHTRLEAVTLAIRGGLMDPEEDVTIQTVDP
jgi:two-component system nitrate/nitrite response regulator NarL